MMRTEHEYKSEAGRWIAAWCSDDFSADGTMDGQDFIRSNKFASADVVSVVPETANRHLFVCRAYRIGSRRHEKPSVPN
jgi:hypothetical protein